MADTLRLYAGNRYGLYEISAVGSVINSSDLGSDALVISLTAFKGRLFGVQGTLESGYDYRIVEFDPDDLSILNDLGLPVTAESPYTFSLSYYGDYLILYYYDNTSGTSTAYLVDPDTGDTISSTVVITPEDYVQHSYTLGGRNFITYWEDVYYLKSQEVDPSDNFSFIGDAEEIGETEYDSMESDGDSTLYVLLGSSSYLELHVMDLNNSFSVDDSTYEIDIPFDDATYIAVLQPYESEGSTDDGTEITIYEGNGTNSVTSPVNTIELTVPIALRDDEYYDAIIKSSEELLQELRENIQESDDFLRTASKSELQYRARSYGIEHLFNRLPISRGRQLINEFKYLIRGKGSSESITRMAQIYLGVSYAEVTFFTNRNYYIIKVLEDEIIPVDTYLKKTLYDAIKLVNPVGRGLTGAAIEVETPYSYDHPVVSSEVSVGMNHMSVYGSRVKEMYHTRKMADVMRVKPKGFDVTKYTDVYYKN